MNQVAADVGAVRVEAPRLAQGLSTRLGRVSLPGPGDPLPVAAVVGDVAVEQQLGEVPSTGPPVEAERLGQEGGGDSRARLCMKPSARSWRIPASTIGTPVRPSRQASCLVPSRRQRHVPWGGSRDGTRGRRSATWWWKSRQQSCLMNSSPPGRLRPGRLHHLQGDRQPKWRSALSIEVRSRHRGRRVVGVAGQGPSPSHRSSRRRASLSPPSWMRGAVEPGAIVPSGGGDHYRVFTPYWRAWREQPRRQLEQAPRSLGDPPPSAIRVGRMPSLRALCGSASPAPRIQEGGETAARRRLERWLRGPLAGYEDGHDDLAAEATSRLSADLHLGCLSPAGVLARVEGRPGGEEFSRQLCWRDFHHQVLAAFPELPVATTAPGGGAAGGAMRAEAGPGARAAPGCRSSTRGCASSSRGLHAQPGAADRRLLPDQDAGPRLADRRRGTSRSC